MSLRKHLQLQAGVVLMSFLPVPILTNSIKIWKNHLPNVNYIHINVRQLHVLNGLSHMHQWHRENVWHHYECLQLSMLSTACSEISCNVKWNVYLAMEIPDRVSFVSGQNSDEIVRSCELSWRFFFSVEPALKLSYYYRPARVIIIRTEEML